MCATRKIYIYERLALVIITTDGYTCITAVGCGTDSLGQHHRQNAKHAVAHSKPSEPPGRTGRWQHHIGNRPGRSNHFDHAEHTFIRWDIQRQHRADAGDGMSDSKGQGVVNCTLYLF